MVGGPLPKDYSVGFPKPAKKRLWKYELAMTAIGIFTFTGILIGLLADSEYVEEYNWFFIPIWFYSSFAGIALLIFLIRKYRTLEQERPSGLTKMYYRDRAQKQCTLCQKHPVSKKHHIQNEHNLKNVNVNDYFKDCGCDICAHYDSSGG